jgi:DNA-binding MarR family transcriptional regulator
LTAAAIMASMIAMSSNEFMIGVLNPLVGYHLRRASGAFAADFAHALAGTGMRQVLFAILSIVSVNPTINQGAVGRALGIKRANMVSLITELVDAGLIDRVTAPDDRRAFALTLKPAGAAMLAECLKRIEAHEAAMLADFSADERDLLLELLARIEARGE